MQRMGSGETLLVERPVRAVHTCNVAGQQPYADLYALHMRNTSGSNWATFVKAGRERKRLSQQGLADATGQHRTTIWRWENVGVRPETAEVVTAVADALGETHDDALRAAGLALESTEAGIDPRLRGFAPNDPVVRKIMSLDVDEDMRQMMLDRHRENLEIQQRRWLEDLERDIRHRGVG